MDTVTSVFCRSEWAAFHHFMNCYEIWTCSDSQSDQVWVWMNVCVCVLWRKGVFLPLTTLTSLKASHVHSCCSVLQTAFSGGELRRGGTERKPALKSAVSATRVEDYARLRPSPEESAGRGEENSSTNLRLVWGVKARKNLSVPVALRADQGIETEKGDEERETLTLD